MTAMPGAPLRPAMAPFDPSVILPLPPGRTARAWQLEAVHALREASMKWRRLLVSAATGTGKGTLLAGLIVSLARRGRRVLFLVHRDELINDVMDRARQVERALPCGKVKGSTNEIDAQVVFASVQSLGPKRLAQLGPIHTVFTDEAHHATAPTYQRIYKHVWAGNASALHIGCTATPFRSAPQGETSGLGRAFDALVYEYDLVRAIQDGALAPLECVQVKTEIDLTGVDLEDEARLAWMVDTEERNALVVTKYREHLRGKPAIAFCASVAHAQHLAAAFQAQGIRARAVWGDMPAADRAAALDLYRTRPDLLPVLCNQNLLTEGFDAPRTEGVLLTRPTGSRGLFAQMVGRATRLSPGKERGLVLDFVDNTTTHDLASFADLSRPEERESPTLIEGQRVRHRTDTKLAEGVVLVVESGAVPRARVDWLGADERWHPVRELVRIVEKGIEEQVFRITPKIRGVKEFQVQLFGGEAKGPSAVAWYEYEGSKGDKRLTATGGDQERTLTVQVLAAEGVYEAWQLVSVKPEGGTRTTEVTLLLAGEPFDAALRAGADAFKRHHIPARRFDAPWQTDPATDRQVAALRKWGIQRDLSKISKGEAAMLMESKIAKAAVDTERKRQGRA